MSFVPLFCPNPTCHKHNRKDHHLQVEMLLTKDGHDVLGQGGPLGRPEGLKKNGPRDFCEEMPIRYNYRGTKKG